MKTSDLIPLSRISHTQEAKLHFSKKERWMKSLLDDFTTVEEGPHEKAEIFFDGTGVVREAGELETICLIKGQLFVKFWALCSKTGQKFLDTIDMSISCAFLSSEVALRFGYEEELDISFEEEMYDLYFYQKRFIPLKDVFLEYMNLEKNQYPELVSQ